MLVFAIIVATMIMVALVVFAVEMNLYKKYEARRDKVGAPKSAARGTQGAPMAS